MPVMYEDEGQEEMGESRPHTVADQILSIGIGAHLRSASQFQVFSNLNLYYHQIDRWAYVSPDVMVVVPSRPLPENLGSYRIGVDGPAPILAVEILSRRSFQQQDLTTKPIIYAQLGVAEYMLIDGTGEFLPQRLLMKRLQGDGTWVEEQDTDGGVSSRLGFRVVLDMDNRPRVIETRTGKPYLRPDEAQAAFEEAQAAAEQAQAATQEARAAREAEAEARRQAEEHARALEAELARLWGPGPEGPKS
jgi:Uma2 family endonuclease